MTHSSLNSEIDKRTICSSDDIPILKFYKNLFNSVFVSLNPFLRIKETSKFTTDDFWNDEIENEEKTKVIENTNPIKWSEILVLSKLENINQIDIALRTGILGLKKEFENKDYLKELNRILEQNNMLSPSEGCIEEIQQNGILNAIAKLGYSTICIGTEFGDLIETRNISELIDSGTSIYGKNLYTEDKNILISVHWDSFQTYICSTKQNVERIVKEANLEGFYCGEKTEIYWSLK
jgi:hypothetical protein